MSKLFISKIWNDILSHDKRSHLYNFYTFEGSNNDTDYLEEPDYEYVDYYNDARTGKQKHISIGKKFIPAKLIYLFQNSKYLLEFIRYNCFI